MTLGQTSSDAGPLVDHLSGFFEGPRWMLLEIGFQAILMHGQVRGLAPVAVAADFGKPSDQKIQEVALDGAARDSCQRGNLLVGNAVVLQPQHMHLALHERVRMIYSLRVRMAHLSN